MLGSLSSNSKNFLFQIFLLTILFLAWKVSAEVTKLPFCGRANDDITPESSTTICNKSDSGSFTAGNYCINSEKTELYKADTNKCEKVPLVANTYYVFVCTDGSTCALKTGGEIDGIANNNSLLVYQYADSKLKQIKNNRYVFVKGTTYHKLISCPNDPPTFATNGKCGIAEAGVYINPKTESSVTDPLIVVAVNSSNENKRDASAKTPVAGSFYLDQSSKDSSDTTKFHKLIRCSSTTECVSDTPVRGVYLDETSYTASYTNLITCDDSTCSSDTVDIEADEYYLNLGVTDTLEKAIIKCEAAGDTCSKINGVSGAYYLDSGSDSEYLLIKCDATKCFTTYYSYTPTKTSAAFLDGGSYTNNKFGNIIKCIGGTGCANPTPALTAGATYFYYFINGDSTSINDAIITCTGATLECSAGKGLAEGFYVDSVDDKHIISCDSSSCVSTPGSKLQGHAYIKAVASGKKDNIITYDTGNSKFVATAITNSIAADGNNLYYIDGSNPKKLISCIGATSGGGECTSAVPTLGNNKYLFYPDGTDPSTHTIVCSSDGCVSSEGLQTCTKIDGGKCFVGLGDGTAMGNGVHCLHTDGKIYLSSNSDGTCAELTLPTGSTITPYIFKSDDYTAEAFTTDNVTDTLIYACDSQKCTQIISSGFKGTTYYYTCDDGLCKKATLADGKTYLSGVATISATQPYLTYGLVEVSGVEIEYCNTVSSPSGIYLNSAVESGYPNALIKCESGKCRAIDGVASKFYISSDKLIKCDTDCVIVEDLSIYTSGYLLDYGSIIGETDTYSKLISCTSTECESVTPVEGYYIDTVTSSNIIKCSKGLDNKIACSTIPHRTIQYYPKHFLDAKGKGVITCTNTGCSLENASYKGYFLNDGNPDKPIIKCTGAASNPCSEETVESTCSKAGKVKKTDDGIFLCVSANNADEHMKIVSKTEGTPEDPAPPPKVYRSVVAANEFPGNNASTDFTVRNDNDGKVILMEDGISLPACGSTCESSKHCVDGNVIKTGDGACAAITGSASSSSVLYFKEDTTKINTPDASTNLPYISYSCTYNDSGSGGEGTGDATSCELLRGYIGTDINGSNTVYCSGWKNDPCSYFATSGLEEVTACKKVKLVTGPKICIKSNGEAISGLDGEKILFYPTEVNEYYGIRLTSNTGFVGLELTTTSAIVTSNLNFNKYGYQINPAALGSLEKALIKCTTPSTISSCTVVDAKEGYYHMGNTSSDPLKGTGNLIECTKDSGCALTASDNGNLNYFIDASDTSKIIKCTGTGTDNECSSINHGGTASNPTHYASTTGELYTCNNEGCIKEDKTKIKGYFLNSSGVTGKLLIKCDGAKCVELADVATYSGVGTVKVTSDGHAFMCVDVGCSGAGEVEIKSLTAPIYKTVSVGAAVFPGQASSAVITVKFDKDGGVFLLEDLVLNGASSNGNYKFTASNELQIYDEGFKNIPETEAGTYVYFFDMNNKRVDAPTSGTLPNVSAYQCVYEETDNKLEDGTFEVIQKSCVQVKGFAKIPGTSNIVQCSGWIREGCTITTLKSCAAEDEGKLGTGNKICFGTETLPLPTATATEPSYVAYKIHDFNTYYGKGKSDTIIYLQLTATSAIAVNPSVNMGYIIKEGNEYKLYKYTLATKSYALGTSDDDGVKLYEVLYDSYTYYASSFLNTENTVLFYCYRGTCTKSNGYIVVKTKVYENSSSSKGEWNEVPDASQVCTSGTASHVSNIKYVTDKVQLCIPKSEGNNPDLVDVEDDIYFLPSGNNLKMYISGDSNKIIATPDPIDGYYYIKDNKIETTADQTNGKLVKCMNKTCTIQSTINDGFYYIVFFNDNPDILIKYTTNAGSQTHSFIGSADAGYYIDNENALVHCTTVPSCEYSHDIGFFKNTGDTTTNIYIQCTAKGCKAIPDPTAECNSDSQVGQLTKGGKLCLKNGITKEFASASQLVYYQSGSVFKYYVNKSTYFGLIKMTSESMVLDFSNTNSDWCVDSSTLAATATSTCSSTLYHCNVDGVCVDSTSNEILPESIRDQKIIAEEEKEESTSAVDIKIECDVRTGNNCDNDYYLVNKEENYSLAESQGALFYCDPEKQKPICSEIFDVGYYIKDKEAIFSCKAGNNGLDCTLDKLTEENIACNANSVGKPFLNQNKLALCLDYDEGATTAYAIDLTPTTSGNYIIKKDSSNLFDIPSNRDYAIVSVKEKIITINLNYTNKLKYVYANKDAKMKLLEKGDTCPKNGSALDETKILELNCVNSKCTTDLTIS